VGALSFEMLIQRWALFHIQCVVACSGFFEVTGSPLTDVRLGLNQGRNE